MKEDFPERNLITDANGITLTKMPDEVREMYNSQRDYLEKREFLYKQTFPKIELETDGSFVKDCIMMFSDGAILETRKQLDTFDSIFCEVAGGNTSLVFEEIEEITYRIITIEEAIGLLKSSNEILHRKSETLRKVIEILS